MLSVCRPHVSNPHTAFGRTSGFHPESCAAECRGNKKGTIIQPCNREGGHFKSFFFCFFFNVKAIHQSLIQHSSISVVAYIRKCGTALGWDRKFLCCGWIHTLKLGAVHLHDNRGSSFWVIQWKRGAPWKCSVFSKGQIYCSLPCTAWPVKQQTICELNLWLHLKLHYQLSILPN